MTDEIKAASNKGKPHGGAGAVMIKEHKTTDVILPAGASLEVNNEVQACRKTIKRALEQAGTGLMAF